MPGGFFSSQTIVETMKLQVTQALLDQLILAGADVEVFKNRFLTWKQGGEYSSYYFGKDAPYDPPRVEGFGPVLQHVHLVPLQDTEKLDQWNKKWKFRSRKTSDRALVYAEDKTHGFLLLYILDEPTAHVVCKMRTAEDKALMEGFAAVAMHFIMNGKVVA